MPPKLWLADSKAGSTLKLKVQPRSFWSIRFPRSCVTLQTKVCCEMREGELRLNIARRNFLEQQISGIDFGDFIFQLSSL